MKSVLNNNYIRIDVNGTKVYYKNNVCQRYSGPAIEFVSGKKFYIHNGNLHREDGPAVIESDGRKSWWLYGQNIECKTQEEFHRLMKLKAFW